MKTICIKTNNKNSIDYLLKKLDQIELKNVYFSCHKFKTFNNILIHYKGEYLELFLSNIAEILTSLIFENYDEDILKTLLHREYFYFTDLEIKRILKILKENSIEDVKLYTTKENILYNIFYNFLKNKNKLFLKGFITFRLKSYKEELERSIDSAVNQYLIEKEYNEFVSLLKLYINSEDCKCNEVHLVYRNSESILLDQNKHLIKPANSLNNKKYLSDISFSSSDIVLNTLLNLIPNKIFIHLIDMEIDDFIHTLELIFEKRVVICTNCSICRIYKLGKNLKYSKLN